MLDQTKSSLARTITRGSTQLKGIASEKAPEIDFILPEQETRKKKKKEKKKNNTHTHSTDLPTKAAPRLLGTEVRARLADD